MTPKGIVLTNHPVFILQLPFLLLSNDHGIYTLHSLPVQKYLSGDLLVLAM